MSSPKSAKSLHPDGHTEILICQGTPPESLAEEALHLLQANDPKTASKFRAVQDVADSGAWRAVPPVKQRELMQHKLDLEIDASKRLAAACKNPEELQKIESDLAIFVVRKKALEATSPEDLGKLSWWNKDQPPWLYKKESARTIRGIRDPHGAGPQHMGLLTPVTDSLGVSDGTIVARVGEPWEEGYRILSDVDGTVEGIRGGTITVRTASGQLRVHKVDEKWAEHFVSLGDRVKKGEALSFEVRQYRRVNHYDASGGMAGDPKQSVMEIRLSEGKWRVRGSELTKKGAIAEDAVVLQRKAELGARAVDPNDPLESFELLSGRNGSGGFDGAEILFTRQGGELAVEIHVREVKSYSGHVPYDDFTAIHENLEDNWRALREEAMKHPGFGEKQLELLEEAFDAERMTVDLWTTPGTRIGNRGGHTTLPRLTEHIEKSMTNGAVSGPRVVEQSHIEEAGKAFNTTSVGPSHAP